MTLGGALDSFRIGPFARETNREMRGLEISSHPQSYGTGEGLEVESMPTAKDLIIRACVMGPP